MAVGAEHRGVATSASSGEPPQPPAEAPTIRFAPISAQNRITGNTRVRRQRPPMQLTPGSQYDYGSADYEELPRVPAFLDVRAEDALGYQKSVPPTFLRRTLLPEPGPQLVAAPLWPSGSPTALYRRVAREQQGTQAQAPAFGMPSAPYPAAPAQAAPTPTESFAAQQAAIYPPEIEPRMPAPVFAGDAAPYPAGYPSASAAPQLPPVEPSIPQTVFPVDAGLRGPQAEPPAGQGMLHRRAGRRASGEAAQAENSAPIPDMPQGFVTPPAAAVQGPLDGMPAMAPADAPPDHPARPSARVRRAAAPALQPPNGAPEPLSADPAIMDPSLAATAPAGGRRVRRAAAAGGYPPAQEARQYADLRPLQEIHDAPTIDPWEMMGWKAPASGGFQQTAVWRVSDLNMFERGAFEEPLDPINNPAEPAPLYPSVPEGYNYSGTDAGIPLGAYGPSLMASSVEPAEGQSAGSVAGEGSAPYAGDQNSLYDPAHIPAYGRERDARPRPTAPSPGERGGRPPADGRAETAPARKPRDDHFRFASLGPRRAALVIACAIALVFCLVEVGKMILSLVENERDLSRNRLDFYQQAGVEPGQPMSGVELLPAGQTYTPTATPAVAPTPTEAPRIPQNDPLIGVVDNGGVTNATFQAALPTPTTRKRTRQSKYPDNPLLNISDAFTELRAQNPDVVGRLVIDGVLDETIVQRNNTFYITHNAHGTLGSSGAVFVDESIVLKKPPENLLLRGQASFEGKLFAPLLQYGTAGASFVSGHGIITCDTLYESASYVLFAVVRADSRADSADYFNYAGYPTFQSDEQMLGYVNGAKRRSVYNINVNVQASDRLLTLATLPEGGDTTSLVLLCRMLRDGESASHIQQD